MKDIKYTLPFSVFVSQHEIMLSSSVAKSLRRICWMSDWSLYNLGATLHQRTSEEKVRELERRVYDETLKPAEERLQAEFIRINQLYEQYDIRHSGSQRKQEKITVDLRDPHGHRLFNLLVGFDNLVCQLDDLCTYRKVTENEYQKIVSNCKRSLKQAALGIRRLVGQAMEQTKENA